MPVTLNYFVEVDMYNQDEFYFGEIVSGDKVIYSHEQKFKCFSFKEDMVLDLHKICAEYGYEVTDVNDTTIGPAMWEEYL
jgi:hypothetical protein